MFNLFPFNLGNGGFSFTSYTNITGSNGFNFFGGINGYFGCNGTGNIDVNDIFNNGFNNKQISNNADNYERISETDINELANELRGLIRDIGKQINIEGIAGEYINAINNIAFQNKEIESDECTFIQFKELNDMYVLKIDLTGIDLRELSVKYDPGVINITLQRSELENNMDFSGYMNQRVVKRQYNKVFDNIEEIDLTRVIKNVDGGNFNLSMPKKYVIDQGSNIVEVDKFTVEEQPKINEKVKK